MFKKILFLLVSTFFSIANLESIASQKNENVSSDLLSELDELNKKPLDPEEEKIINQIDELMPLLIQENYLQNMVNQGLLPEQAKALIVEMQELNTRLEQIKIQPELLKQEKMAQELDKIFQKKMASKKNLNEQEITQFVEKLQELCPLVLEASVVSTRLQKIQAILLEKLMTVAMKALLEVTIK